MDFIRFDKRIRTDSYNMIQLESHPYYEIYFLTEGSRNVVIQDVILTLAAPAAMIIPPFTPHRTEGGPYHRYNIYASPQVFEEETIAFLDANQAPKVFLFREEKKIIFKLLADAYELSDDTMKRPFDLRRSLLYTILFYLQKSIVTTAQKKEKSNGQILNVVNYINQHYTEEITINSLCRQFYMARSSLCRKFQQVMECSVYDYVLFVKINHARKLLFETNKPIQAIANECGFSSLNYFSLIFKQKTGVSPSQYRKTR